MSAKRYTDKSKIEAVKRIVDRGYKVDEVAKRLGVTSNSLPLAGEDKYLV
mgnify:CR=1 FL=1